MATPTKDPVFPPSTERATPAPDGSAISTPTNNARKLPLWKAEKKHAPFKHFFKEHFFAAWQI